MLTLRCTQKLLSHLKVKPRPHPAASTTTLGDWYANPFSVGRERLVLCVSAKTLLPILLPLAGPDLAQRLAAGLKVTLVALGAPQSTINAELDQMGDVTIAKTVSRVVLGSMNDLQFGAQCIREEEPKASLLQVGLELAQTPCSPIDYARPVDATLEVLGCSTERTKPKGRTTSPPPNSATKAHAIAKATYEEMVEEATVDAYGDAEQATGWHCVLDEHLVMPFETEVLGVTVRVVQIDLLDDLSIVAVCRRGQHRQAIPLLDLPLPTPPPSGAEWVDAYRRWKR